MKQKSHQTPGISFRGIYWRESSCFCGADAGGEGAARAACVAAVVRPSAAARVAAEASLKIVVQYETYKLFLNMGLSIDKCTIAG